jgi:hypothetical protein
MRNLFLYNETERGDCMDSDYYYLKLKNKYKKYIRKKEKENEEGSIKERAIT